MNVSITGRAVPSAAERQRLFDQYIAPNLAKIRRYVTYMTFPGEDADDNLQEVLVSLFRYIHLYNPSRASLAAWTCTVTRSVLYHLRLPRIKGRVLPTVSLDALLESDAAAAAASGVSVDAEVGVSCDVPPLSVTREMYPDTYEALQGLTALQRRALLLVSEGWSTAEVAAELRLPTTAAVRQMLTRARAKMRAALASRGAEALS